MKLNFTEHDLSCILYEGAIWDENDNNTWETVSEEQTYVDLGKGYTLHDVIIKEIATGKFYKAELMKNEYHFKENLNAKWKEVFPYTETKTVVITKYK